MTHSDADQFGALVRRARLVAGLSQEQLAERSGLSARAISDLERGLRKTPHPETLRMLAEGLALSSEDREALLERARPDLQSSLPHVRPSSDTVHRLPVFGAPLIGREQEVADLVSQLCGSDRRLTTLTGPGGVGKTRLALEATRLAAPAFADGVVFVDLAPIRDPRLVASTVAHALGVRDAGAPLLLETLGIAVRHRRLLLLLDNFEQVIEAAPDIATLLASAPELRILVTSRESLRVRGEYELVIQPLELPPDRAAIDPEQILATPSAALFVQAARIVKHDFRLTTENAPAVAAICRRLDGLPLAIELAASRVKYYPPSTLIEHLDRRMPVLTGGPRDVPARQQTLRDTIAWSYDLLVPAEQALFRRLGIFPGGATIPAIEAVALGAGGIEIDLLGGLASLVDKSLIRQVAGHEGPPRFAMMETLREFALDALLQAEEVDRARQALAEWILRFVTQWSEERVDPLSLNFANLRLFDQEFENVRLAFAQFSARGDAEAFATLFTFFFHCLYLRGRFSEGLSLGQRSLELAQQHPIPDHLRGATLSCLANLETVMGHAPVGEALALEGLSLLTRSPGHRRLIPVALLTIAVAMREQGRYAEARVYAEEAHAVAEASGDVRHLAGALYHIGRLAFLQNDLDRAAACLGEARRQGTATSQNETIWSSAGYLAAVHIRRGNLLEAAESLREADRVWREMGGQTVSLFLNIVGAFVAQIQPVVAVWIYGAVGAHKDAIGAVMEDEPWIAQVKRDLRAQLGEAAFEEACLAGQRFNVEYAVELMRDVLDQMERGAQ